MGRRFDKLISVDEAVGIGSSLNIVKPGVEETGLFTAVGRVVAQDYLALMDSPPHDRSAVDGYAVRSADTLGASPTNPVVLRVDGVIAPGEEPRCRVEPGVCCEIYTGAEMPPGADAVVMYEDTRRLGDMVEVYRPVPRYANVSRRGEDYRAGETLVAKNTLLRPWHVAALASQGYTGVVVYRRLRVGIVVTGSELVEPGTGGGGIYNSTGYIVHGLLSETPVTEPVYHGIVRDDPDELIRVLEEALAEDDVVITTGSTSLGGTDLLPEAVERLGEWVFRGVALRPGKPVGLAVIMGKPLFTLSGYPVAAWTGYKAVVEPILYSWLGIRRPVEPSVEAVLTRRLPNPVGYTSYVRVRVYCCGGELCAEPYSIKGSGLLSSLTRTNAYIVVPEGLEGYEKGERVKAYLTGPLEPCR